MRALGGTGSWRLTRLTLRGAIGAVLVGSAALCARPASAEDLVLVNWRDVALVDAARMASEATGRTIHVAPNLPGTLTLEADAPLTHDQLFALFEKALRERHLVLDRQGPNRYIVRQEPGAPAVAAKPPANLGNAALATAAPASPTSPPPLPLPPSPAGSPVSSPVTSPVSSPVTGPVTGPVTSPPAPSAAAPAGAVAVSSPVASANPPAGPALTQSRVPAPVAPDAVGPPAPQAALAAAAPVAASASPVGTAPATSPSAAAPSPTASVQAAAPPPALATAIVAVFASASRAENIARQLRAAGVDAATVAGADPADPSYSVQVRYTKSNAGLKNLSDGIQRAGLESIVALPGAP